MTAETPRRVEDTNAELGRAYTRLAELSRELADEQALTRRLKVVIALAPYATRRWLPPAPPRRTHGHRGRPH